MRSKRLAVPAPRREELYERKALLGDKAVKCFGSKVYHITGCIPRGHQPGTWLASMTNVPVWPDAEAEKVDAHHGEMTPAKKSDDLNKAGICMIL